MSKSIVFGRNADTWSIGLVVLNCNFN